MRGTVQGCRVIDWRITAECNSGCEYCYASTQIASMRDNELQHVLNEIINSGCRTVCISGGEPLLHDQVLGIIKKLHSSGISIYLSTNGSKYFDYREDLEKYISKLSLPLDGYDPFSNCINGRSLKASNGEDKGFETVKSILDYYESHPHSFAIKIGTVLTKKNKDINHFKKMLEFLKSYSIDMWKIYEFIPEAKGKSNRGLLELSRTELESFAESLDEVKEMITEHAKFECVLSTRSMRDASYFIIQPNGTVIIPIDGHDGVKEEEIGDLKIQSITEVFRIWNEKRSSVKHDANYETRSISRSWAQKHIDQIDKEIIYWLDQDPLQELSEITRKVEKKYKINDEEISRRIEKLFSIRAIRHIMPVINVAQFGLEVFLLNLYFKKSTTMASSQIAEILCHDQFIAWVAECYEYNNTEDTVIFRIAIFEKNNAKLYERIKNLRELFGEALYQYEIDCVPEKYICGQGFLLEATDQSMISHDHITLNASQAKLTRKEYAVVSAMNSSERLTVEAIAKAAAISEDVVRKTIRELLARAIINKFQVVLDTNVLGYQCYLFFVKFRTHFDKEQFEEHVKRLPCVSHINTLNTGRWDIDVEIHVEKASMCSTIWSDLEDRFGESMLESKLVRIQKDHKFKFLIDVTLSVIEKAVEKRWWQR